MPISSRSVIIAAALTLTVVVPVQAQALPEPVPLVSVAREPAPTIAARNGLTEAQVPALDGDHFEVDRQGNLRSVEPLATATSSDVDLAAPDDVFALHSRPTSAHTIYLDFDGHAVENTQWRGGAKIIAPPYDADGDPSSFGPAERDTIYQAFLATAENFRPFDVDVTTQAPSEDRITRDGSRDLEFGSRVVITPQDVTGCGCGGQSYIGVFDRTSQHASYQPAWAYSGAGSTDGKLIAEVASHETGHTLGLTHDGQNGGPEYYPGHENWASTMGAAHAQPITQWSKGEYVDANNHQDDFTVIAGKGAPLLADDYTAVVPLTSGITGVIGTDADTDAFTVSHGGGPVTITARPARFSPNLDIRLTITDASGGVVATVDPPVVRQSAAVATGLDAQFAADLPAGEYTVQVEGVGYGDPGVNGYTGYSSVGEYTLTVG